LQTTGNSPFHQYHPLDLQTRSSLKAYLELSKESLDILTDAEYFPNQREAASAIELDRFTQEYETLDKGTIWQNIIPA
jgi:hypothetical protein